MVIMILIELQIEFIYDKHYNIYVHIFCLFGFLLKSHFSSLSPPTAFTNPFTEKLQRFQFAQVQPFYLSDCLLKSEKYKDNGT